MTSPAFIDEIAIFVRAGHGGAGACHFRRERYRPKGGPDGGNGGPGGSIILQGDQRLRTLLDFRYRKHIIAPDGQPGASNRRTGACGRNRILPVPLGTVVQQENDDVLGEITTHQQQCIVAAGGRGGLGNAHFANATRQTPYYAQLGEKGQAHRLRLVLKMVGDVSLVGMPNAGKSTLLSVLSAAQPKIGAYPFTTLTPNIGVVSYQHYPSFVLVDVPGIIQGASQGKGLGLRFLKHIERAKLLLLVIAADSDIADTYQRLQRELRSYDPRLLHKKQLVLITKTDLIDDKHAQTLPALLPKHLAIAYVSAREQKGLNHLKQLLCHHLQAVA